MGHLWILVRRSFVYGFGQGVSRLLTLFSLPVLTHYLAPEKYAIITLLAVLGVGLRVIFGVGSTGAAGIVYFRRDDPAHRQKTIWALLTLTALGGVAMVTLSALLSPLGTLLFGRTVPSQQALIVLYVAALGLQLLAEPLLLRLQFDGRAGAYVAVSVSGACVTVGGSVFLVAVSDLGVMGWVLGQAGGAAILVLLAAAVAGCSLGRPAGAPDLMRAVLRAGIPLIPGGAAVLIMLNSAPYFVGRLLGLEAAGIFGIGYQIGMGMALATMAVSAAWMPFFQSYMRRVDEASEIFPGLTTCYLAGFGVLTLLFFALAPPVVAILADPRFHDAWQVVGPVAYAQMLMGLWGMLLPGLYFAAETGYVSILQSASAIVTIATHLLLTPLFGMPASAAALVLGTALLVLLQLGFNRWRGYAVRVVRSDSFAVLFLLLTAGCAAIWLIGMAGVAPLPAALAATGIVLLYATAASFALAPAMRHRLAATRGRRPSGA